MKLGPQKNDPAPLHFIYLLCISTKHKYCRYRTVPIPYRTCPVHVNVITGHVPYPRRQIVYATPAIHTNVPILVPEPRTTKGTFRLPMKAFALMSKYAAWWSTRGRGCLAGGAASSWANLSPSSSASRAPAAHSASSLASEGKRRVLVILQLIGFLFGLLLWSEFLWSLKGVSHDR